MLRMKIKSYAYACFLRVSKSEISTKQYLTSHWEGFQIQ